MEPGKREFTGKAEEQRLRRELIKKEKRLKLKENELQQREHMFEMQLKVLEHELSLFAIEREKYEKDKKRLEYTRRLEYEKKFFKQNNRINAGMYFLGVHDELSLKKRYRDLLKLFHPDSMNGDLDAMQAINKEYSELKKKYENM